MDEDYKYDCGKFTEDELEHAIIELFEQQGYDYVDGGELERRHDSVLLKDDLRSFLRRRYANANLTETELQACVNRLVYLPSWPLYDGCRETFWAINEGFDLVREDPSLPAVHIDYIDFDNAEANEMKVVNQYTVSNIETRRPDLLVFVNGIPLCILEFKTAIEESKDIHDAWVQITTRYARGIPALLKYCCLAVISDGANNKLGTCFTPYEYFYSWNKANDEDTVANGISSLFTMIEGVFAKDRFLAIVRDFVFFPDETSGGGEIVCRYPQFFAANKMLDSIVAHLRPNGDGKGGTYFGATGCGKTYVMLFLARLMKLRRTKELGNPTVVVIVDREDLDSQTAEKFVVAKRYLHEEDVRSIETREDLGDTLRNRASGGVYITTIQKFCESTGLLSERSNIVCMSDEAHRTQTGVGSKLIMNEKGAFTRYGFAKYLRDAFPNATYAGFSGTPIDATYAVFGALVDRYTMRQSRDDGITVSIAYEPRLARVLLDGAQARKIQEYYDRCAEEGSNSEQIEESMRAMSSMSIILRDPDRLEKLAADLVKHYEALCEQKPNVVQKAMVVCSDRMHAYDLYKAILAIRPDWGVARKAENEDELTQEQLEDLEPMAKMNIVATRGKDDPDELYELCGSKEWRAQLDHQFKNDDSNFRIAIVVDMWITGFDVPSLAVMYVDKPLRKHTLVQTISRVNRVYEGKDMGLVVDYFGIREKMMEAIKDYGDDDGGAIDELEVTLGIFRNHLAMLEDLMTGFDYRLYFEGMPLERLKCLNDAVEFVQSGKELQDRYMGLARVLKQAYSICAPSGELSDREDAMAQFYLAVRSIIYKQTIGDAPDADVMNATVERMVKDALSCSGVESILDAQDPEDLYSEEFLRELDKVKLPITKFNALLKLVRKAIRSYGRTNKVRSLDFDERLQKVVTEYNSRDGARFTSEVVSDFVDRLSDELLDILRDIKQDKDSFKGMGITFEEKAFYDILVKVRDDNEFEFADEKCLVLARSIKELVDDKVQYADWATRDDIKSQLNMDLTVLLYKNGYPPEWNEEVFDKVMEQAENYKKWENEG